MWYYMVKVVVTAILVVLISEISKRSSFIALPLLLGWGVNFYLSLSVSIGITAVSYWLMVLVLRHNGVEL